MIELNISIINYRTAKLTAKCLKSILTKKWKTHYKIYVVDNGSNDGSLEYLKKNFPEVNFIESKKNLGFAGGHNLVLKSTSAKYFLILNSDVEVLENALDNFVQFMDKNDFAVAGCYLYNKDMTFQPNGGDLPTATPVFIWISGLDDILYFIREHLPSLHRKFKSYYSSGKEVGWVGGTAMLIRSDILEKIGFLDDHIFMYGEDIEFCLRAKKGGFKVGWTDNTKMVHMGGGSLNDPSYRQWVGELKGLRYIYKKHFNLPSQLLLWMSIYIFTFLRILAFAVVGRLQVSKTYAKVIANI